MINKAQYCTIWVLIIYLNWIAELGSNSHEEIVVEVLEQEKRYSHPDKKAFERSFGWARNWAATPSPLSSD